MITSSPLQRGETIGVVSPSWGGAGAFPHRVKQAVCHIEALGFAVKLAPQFTLPMGAVQESMRMKSRFIFWSRPLRCDLYGH